MEDMDVEDNITIQSHKGPYSVEFNDTKKTDYVGFGSHYIVDKNVANLYDLQLQTTNVMYIDANEESKNFDSIGKIISELVKMKMNKSSVLIAIGGGITQDITAFIASVYMRGIQWKFIPTTLLAQADSCIGSKSSVNLGDRKNLLGTFNPPKQILLNTHYLSTLSNQDIMSGISEILKLYIINLDIKSISEIQKNYKAALIKALSIKKEYIEEDEFDKKSRKLLNYGHCIGHAIESASHYLIPHGIAVAMGMIVVNNFSVSMGNLSLQFCNKINDNLRPLIEGYKFPRKFEEVKKFMQSDKKNTSETITLIELDSVDSYTPYTMNIKFYPNEQDVWNSIEQVYYESM